MARDSVGRTFLVATVLCIACSVLVSAAAVVLRPRQEANKALDRKKNVLIAAQLYHKKHPPEQSVDEIFAEKVETVLIDLESAEPVDDAEIDVASYDQREAARKRKSSVEINPDGALPGFDRREEYAFVYLVTDDDNKLSQVVLPIYGKGLWSTLYGFIAVEADSSTVSGITFYEHAETPGLGGEVDNPSWKAQWTGKKLFDDSWDMQIEVLKGKVNRNDEDAIHQIDGLSGATITTRGVSDLVQYWIGEYAFGPFLSKLRSGKVKTAARKKEGATDG